jgi:hypothetical protein
VALRIANRAQHELRLASERRSAEQALQLSVDPLFFDDEFLDALQLCVHV